MSVPEPTRAPGGSTNAYLIGSDPALLVDPADQTDKLDGALADRSVEHLAVTHTHPDHVGAIPHYATQTGATVWGRAGRTDRLEAVGVIVDRTFQEGTVIPTDPPVRVLTTPGHAPDHVSFHIDAGPGEAPVAVIGDLAVANGSVFVGKPDGEMRTYLVSLRRLLVRNYDVLYPGHGPVIEQPNRRLTELLTHRRNRENQIATAVREGAETVDEIIDAAYDRELGALRDLAGQSVRAHLEKLAREGHISWDGSQATHSPTGRFYQHRT